MLLTITTTHQPATDLGYLLHKNPSRLHPIDVTFGEAYVAYPEATNERCTAALIVDVDTVALVRKREGLGQYVNDRPYAASSFLSVALHVILSREDGEGPSDVPQAKSFVSRRSVIPSAVEGSPTDGAILFVPQGIPRFRSG
ncbi:MAG TPA: hypothetical protein VF911_18720 [Thermoanaerobaculia bacterium]|jgi:hypothetical protein